MEFIKYTRFYFLFSALVVIPGLISLIIFGLRPSIDFTGGTLIEIQTRQTVSEEKLRASVETAGFTLDSQVTTSDDSYLLRLKPMDQTQHDGLISALNTDLEGVISLSFETVGPSIGNELTTKAALAILVSSVTIVAYIAWSFRSVPKPYSSIKFGVTAIFALIHDLLVVLGIFSLLGHFMGVEIDALFVTALLTVIGFSVHDTIVVYDRIRENLVKQPHLTFTQIADFSLTETLGRSLNTTSTVALALVALLLFGGTPIRWFIVALLVGIISGTYSSIFNATPLLVIWENISSARSHPHRR